jgi:uncharacterized protein YdhG (YjbR/CyaY superfamily)
MSYSLWYINALRPGAQDRAVSGAGKPGQTEQEERVIWHMDSSKKSFKTVDDYISSFPDDTRQILQQLRQIIRGAAHDAEESISYNMPTYKLHGSRLVYFAAWKNHIALYAAGSAANAYADELAPYLQDKGTLQFPLDAPMPYDLVRRIVQYRAQGNLEAQNNKSV